MEFPQNYFCAEVRDDFEIPAMMKRAWAAELEVLSVIADVCERHHLQYLRITVPCLARCATRASYRGMMILTSACSGRITWS